MCFIGNISCTPEKFSVAGVAVNVLSLKGGHMGKDSNMFGEQMVVIFAYFLQSRKYTFPTQKCTHKRSGFMTKS